MDNLKRVEDVDVAETGVVDGSEPARPTPFLALTPAAREVASAPWVEPGDDVRTRPELLNAPAVFVRFPKFREGRGYSSARILRELGYAGDIRAVGDLTIDQIVFLKRAGFSSVAPDRPIDPEHANATLKRFAFVYQKAADDRAPAWKLRHNG